MLGTCQLNGTRTALAGPKGALMRRTHQLRSIKLMSAPDPGALEVSVSTSRWRGTNASPRASSLQEQLAKPFPWAEAKWLGHPSAARRMPELGWEPYCKIFSISLVVALPELSEWLMDIPGQGAAAHP